MKTISNKIEQSKAQCSLEKQTVKNSALSSGNVGKYKFLIGEEILPGKGLL